MAKYVLGNWMLEPQATDGPVWNVEKQEMCSVAQREFHISNFLASRPG